MRICSECQRENEAHYRFCLGCGHDLGGAAGEPVWTPPARASKVVRCEHCGAKVTDAQASHCPQCSAPLGEQLR
jgi:hypothetical protein